MDEQKVRRVRRTPEQRADEIDSKIQRLTEELDALADRRELVLQEFDRKDSTVRARIAALEQRKKELFEPKPRKPRKTKKEKIQDLIKSASKAGLKPEEIAQRLGLEQPED